MKAPNMYKTTMCILCHVITSNTGGLCVRQNRRTYIREPRTGCISSKKVLVRTCAGPCTQRNQTDPSIGAVTYPTWNKPGPVTNSLTRLTRSHTEGTRQCCKATKEKLRSVQFRCPTLGRSFKLHTVKLIRQCACQSCS